MNSCSAWRFYVENPLIEPQNSRWRRPNISLLVLRQSHGQRYRFWLPGKMAMNATFELLRMTSRKNTAFKPARLIEVEVGFPLKARSDPARPRMSEDDLTLK
jgi:hypothetical protein